jgi:hypothetical protein
MRPHRLLRKILLPITSRCLIITFAIIINNPTAQNLNSLPQTLPTIFYGEMTSFYLDRRQLSVCITKMLMELNWMSKEASSPLFALRSVIFRPTLLGFAKRNWILLNTLSATSFPHNSSAASGIIVLLCLLVPSHSKLILNLEELCPFVSTITLAGSLLGFRI